MAVEQQAEPKPIVGLDTKDFFAFEKMANDPDAHHAAKEAWKSAAAPVMVEETEVETEAEPAAAEENTASETEEEETEDEGAEPEKPKKLTGYKRTIAKLERQIEELQKAKSSAEPAKPEPPKRKGLPLLSEFDYDEVKHAEALEVELNKRVADSLQAKENEAATRTRLKAFEVSCDEARKVHADFDEVMSSVTDVKFGGVVGAALAECANKGEVVYAISKDPALVAELDKLSHSGNELDSVKAVAIITRVDAQIEKSLSSSTVSEAPTKTQVVSRAPAPGKPISGRAGGPVRNASTILAEYSSTGNSKKADALAAEYFKLTGKEI